MKKQFILALSATLLGSASTLVRAEEVPLKQCPEPVRKTIRDHAGFGRVDEIKAMRSKSGMVYVADIDLPGRRERTLHVAVDGVLLKVVDELKLGELPAPVKTALRPWLGEGNRFDGADRVTSGSKTEYHVDFDLDDEVDLHLVLGESGEILRRREEADF